MEIRAYLSYRRRKLPFPYWRSTHGHEVDFLIGEKTAVEVKATSRVVPGDFKGLKALAEILASWGAEYAVDSSRYYCVGQAVNANHIRAVTSGWVYGVAKPLHMGRKSHVWEVFIRDEKDRLVCISRMTMAVLNIPSQYKKMG